MKELSVTLILRACLRLFSVLPLVWNHRLGAFIGWLLYIFPSEAKRISRINIAYCFPQWPEQERQRLLKKSLQETGKFITELGYLWLRPAARTLPLLEVRNRELIDQARSNKQAVIILTPHLGCWEIGGLYAGKQWQAAIFYQPPKIKSLEQIIRHGRSHSGSQLVAADKRGLLSLLKHLRNGGVTGILPDQTPKDRQSGTFAPFFNHRALTINLIGSLARKTDALVVICYAQRKADSSGYILEFFPVDEAIKSDDPLVSATALNQAVEQMVIKIPEQYLWSYKRFKQTETAEQKNIYDISR